MSVLKEEELEVTSKTNETVNAEDSLQKNLRMFIYINLFYLSSSKLIMTDDQCFCIQVL